MEKPREAHFWRKGSVGADIWELLPETVLQFQRQKQIDFTLRQLKKTLNSNIFVVKSLEIISSFNDVPFVF